MPAKFYYLQNSAHLMVTLAIRHGDLKPSEYCDNCGKLATDRQLDAHHEDYSKPLDVTWLCRSCHSYHHNPYNPRQSRKLNTVISWFDNHPEMIKCSSRELAKIIGVSHVTINKAQRMLRNA